VAEVSCITPKPLPPVGYLRQLLAYEPETGAFTWLVTKQWKFAVAGSPAGTVTDKGYLSIMLDGKRYPAHRLAWKMMTGEDPPSLIDHADGDGMNNRFSNLRCADYSENIHNSCLSRRNTSGAKGVSLCCKTGRWKAYIAARGRYQWLGYHDTVDAAEIAVSAARQRLHGAFACSRPEAGGAHGRAA
jgi:hypothetical protein